MRNAIVSIILATAGCYSQSEPVAPSHSAPTDSVSAQDISGATFCESTPHPSFSQICLSVDPSNPPTYTITHDDCTETGYLANSRNPGLTLVQYDPRNDNCLGTNSKVYLATAVFTDGGLILSVESTQAVIELEQVF